MHEEQLIVQTRT